MKNKIIAACILLIAAAPLMFADSGTWKVGPPGTNWRSSKNWTPKTVPDNRG